MSGGLDSQVLLWNPETGEQLHGVSWHGSSPVASPMQQQSCAHADQQASTDNGALTHGVVSAHQPVASSASVATAEPRHGASEASGAPSDTAAPGRNAAVAPAPADARVSTSLPTNGAATQASDVSVRIRQSPAIIALAASTCGHLALAREGLSTVSLLCLDTVKATAKAGAVQHDGCLSHEAHHSVVGSDTAAEGVAPGHAAPQGRPAEGFKIGGVTLPSRLAFCSMDTGEGQRTALLAVGGPCGHEMQSVHFVCAALTGE